MRSCRDISALVSKELDQKLSLAERVAVKFHLLMCSQCRNFRKQSHFIRNVTKQYVERLQDHQRH